METFLPCRAPARRFLGPARADPNAGLGPTTGPA